MRIVLQLLGVLMLLLSANNSIAQQSVAIPSAVVESWSYLIGNWTVEGTAGQATIQGTASFEWAANKGCYIGKQIWHIGESGRTVYLELIGGWDAAANETIEQGFSSAGRAATVHYQSPGQEASVIEGRIDGVTGPGSTFAGTVKMERMGPDEFQLTSMVDGRLVHSLKYVRDKDAP